MIGGYVTYNGHIYYVINIVDNWLIVQSCAHPEYTPMKVDRKDVVFG